MIVKAIIGILAAVAIPAFSRYVKKSRTTEAHGYLNKMYAGAVVFEKQTMSTNTETSSRNHFPPNAKDD